MHYVEVSIGAQHAGRRFYTYESTDMLHIGHVIYVPFGRTKQPGIVRSIVKKPTFKTKHIHAIYDYVLPQASLKLLSWMEAFYPYDYGEITNLFLPANILTKERAAKEPSAPPHITALPKPTPDQVRALKVIQEHQSVLLHGDTGTGKTRVFLEVAQQVIACGKSVLILTPEIGLTPQLEQTLRDSLSCPIHLMHSKRTPAQRKQAWLAALRNTEPSVFLGPRSSLFLPYASLGLVVIDEAHDGSYKSFQAPKYQGLYVAAQLAKLHGAQFIQSTATPNVSDYYMSTTKQVPVARMTTIAAGDKPAQGIIVDMTKREQFSQHNLLSDPLIELTRSALHNKEQVMFFLNRRGSARIVQCNSCGAIEECPRCGIPYTFHHDTHTLSCHICGTHTKATSQCSQCQSVDILFFSPGTKGIEQDMQSLFPTAKVARFDLDVSAKDTIARKLTEVKNGDFDIIVGTQVISKGFDLPNLSVVGVLNADSSLAMPDFRAEEITFQQLYQVTGRVGRGHRASTYVIQTRQPHNPVIEAALARNWQAFYEYELAKRKQFGFAPFSFLALASITKKQAITASNTAQNAKDILAKHKDIVVLGPTPSFYESAQGCSTWQLLIKARSRSNLVAAMLDLPTEWNIDVDPTSVL